MGMMLLTKPKPSAQDVGEKLSPKG